MGYVILQTFIVQRHSTYISMAQKTSIPKGTRDFTPAEMGKRNYIFESIREVFRLYGFQQIETPAMENLSTLTGKYGEEGDKLLFKILNSGNYAANVTPHDIQELPLHQLTSMISEKGLRYDLTVPFARFVVQNRDKITFPFKRYQIQPVWRADRPQKGRYREFYQCDADVVGSNSLLNELELIQIIEEVFRRLKIAVVIKMNHRKILTGIAEIIGEPDKIIDITIAIDKIEKVGLAQVNEELLGKGISTEALQQLQPILTLKGTNTEKLNFLKTILATSSVGLVGIAEMEQIFALCNTLQIAVPIELDLTLARGLNYYTGAIFEVKALDIEMGSITGGGRYDNLTGVFGMEGVSGVGISFGADRIFDVLNQLNLYPEGCTDHTTVLFACFGEKEQSYCLPLAQSLRRKGVKTEVYPEASKIKKQMAYAHNNHIPWVAIVGESEMLQQKIMLKNMKTGEQTNLDRADFLEYPF